MATSSGSNPYAPRRMFPALAWLHKQREASSAAPTAASPTPQPTAPGAPSAAPRPTGASGRPASASSAAPQPPPQSQPTAPGAAPALSGEQLDLALLVSCLPRWLHSWLVGQLQPLVARRRAQPQPRTVADLLREYPQPDSQQGRLSELRAELFSALLIGLATAAAPLSQVSRPTRNRSLVAQAERLAAVAGELARRRDADPPEQELARALTRLRRFGQ